MLQIDSIDVFYGQAQALEGLSFDATAGSVVALLGRNGAGKSTTLKAIMGLLPLARGAIRLNEERLGSLAPRERVARGLGYVPEERRIFAGLTVAENLEVGRRAAKPGVPSWDQARLFALFPALADFRDRRAGTLSGGEQQMLALARTLAGNPRLLLLDEPSAGLAPRLAGTVADSLKALEAAGLTVILSEQNLALAAAVARRAVVLESGRVAYDGPIEALLADEALRRRLLAV
ncbi:MAG: ABC transporter ATP-binding protein [Kiloniellales bacterium]